MIFSLFFHGSIIVILLSLYSRWLDEEVLADLCLYSLVIELSLAIFNVGFIYYTDCIFFLHCGYILVDTCSVNISIIFCFDELSGFFFGVLDFALILCFYFLIEYFEYDSNSSGIILLSAMFSHFAMWYFCVFDLFLLIFFWETISLISFLLIQHWSYRLPTYKAGIKVFFISQLGDVPLFFFTFLLISRFGTTDLTEILSQIFLLTFEYVVLETTGLLVSFPALLAFFLSFTLLLKAAQFFFYPWLLDAMEAPVPISAQLHSSTLVIIGFYFYLRFQNLFILAPAISLLLLLFGVGTVVGASILGFFQEDGKKLLACSTASQLGYAVTGLSLFFFEEALLLMAFCCCNKAFTFIWFGTLMDRFSGISDFRFISGISGLSALEHAGIFISLANFTILPGAFSWHVKALFLKGQYTYEFFFAKYALDVLTLTWFFSSLYLIYLYLILFLKPSRGISRNSTLVVPALRASAALAHNFATTSTVARILLSDVAIKLHLNIFTYVFNLSTGTQYPRRMSTSFFYLLFFSFILLLHSTNFFSHNYVDMGWIGDTYYFINFFVSDFYG